MITLEHVNFGWLHAPPSPPACCHCLLLRDGGRYALVDTGIGTLDVADPLGRVGEQAIQAAGFRFIESMTAKAQLAARGIDAAAVTDIFLTHCDPDHVGGLADFPAATVHVASEELANMQTGNPRYSPAQFDHSPRWKTYSENNADFFGLAARSVKTVLDAEIRLVPLFGHTLGHCGVAVFHNDQWTFHIGDAYYLRAELENPEHPVDELATMAADDDPLRRETLQTIRQMVANAELPITFCGYHDSTELPEGIPAFENVN